MLTFDERKVLRDQFGLVLSQNDPKNLIKTYFVNEAPTMLRDFPADLKTYDDYSVRVIEYCLISRWSLTPSLMELLLTQLLASGLSSGTVLLTAALTRVRSRQDPNDRVFDTRWVLNEQPFLNRNDLRPVLKTFIQSSDRSLLQINGPGAGLSYTAELLDYLAGQFDELHFVPVKIPESGAPSYSVEAFAADLLDPMGIDVPPSSGSSDAANLCRLILRSTKQQQGVWIFLMDGFGEADLQPSVKELARLLAVRCTAPEYRRKMRVVFINYGEPCADLPRAAVARESVPLPSVTRQDVIECLIQLNELRTQQGRPAIDGLGTIADKIMAGIPEESGSEEVAAIAFEENDPEKKRKKEKVRLRHLYDQLWTVATRL
ncbi:hypothetical protein CT676_27765 [Bradyrhizobium sp. MOS001]|uniref:hypothetical protein n=1 Tax=Bradyrhizobium sp. MOS001 TaxID=2133948 RepID=UPI0010757F04|nr:hypothetical protein [Bradyrhizobium sp. MOS001]TFW57803.1 hypothetical protein CT676_27765 [Bradyrhizobium sp. MOS001]